MKPKINKSYSILLVLFFLIINILPAQDKVIDAFFTYTVNSDSSVTFYNESSGDIDFYYWDYGDFENSGDTNYAHTHYYPKPGQYPVSLFASNIDTTETDLHTENIIVGNIGDEILADFLYENTQNLNCQLRNISVNYKYSYWSFGDGTFSNNNQPYIKTYQDPGTYQICLTVYDSLFQEEDVICHEVTVGEDTMICNAAFEYEINGNQVDFFAQDNDATEYYWQFGDGNSASQQNPSNTYQYNGFYNAHLVVYNENNGCMDHQNEIILIGDSASDCQANFDYFSDLATNKVHFINTSLGSGLDGAYWDFNDGNHSTQNNPVHDYDESGYYDVCLTVWNEETNCYDTKCKNIKAGDDTLTCHANFIFSVTDLNNTVNFEDESYGEIQDWYWEFGDGTSSTDQDPIHAYDEAGLYLVHLKVTNIYGIVSHYFNLVNVNSGVSGLEGMFGFIFPSSPGIKGQPVDYKSATYGEPARTIWTFGDGEMDSVSMFPTHVYEGDDDIYEVCLTISDPRTNQADTYCRDIDLSTIGNPNKLPYNTTNNTVNIFPNPVKQDANIVVNIENRKQVSINIYNTLGAKIKPVLYRKYLEKGIYSIEMNLENLDKGIYYLKGDIGNEVITKKFIIVH